MEQDDKVLWQITNGNNGVFVWSATLSSIN